MSIGSGSFSYTNITTITIPKGVTLIEFECFGHCSALTSIQLPSTLIKINELTFSNTNLKEITIEPHVESFDCLVPLFIKNMLNKKGIICPKCYVCQDDIIKKEIRIAKGNCIIPEGVSIIESRYFENNKTIKKVNLPSTIRSLNESCFSHCSELIEINLPEGLETIEFGSFNKCIKLKRPTIPKSVTALNESAFDPTKQTCVIN